MNKTMPTTAPAGNRQREKHALNHYPAKIPGNNGKPTVRASVNKNHLGDELTKLRVTLADIQRMKTEARHELEMVKRIRVEVERCQQETEAKARSQAHMLILQARLATHKEIAKFKGTYGEQIQKILTDFRMIQITAQEDLEAQRRFTDAVKIRALSLACQEDTEQISKTREEAISV